MQTMATITETQTASYRTVHDILRFAPRWPDPKSCCGVLFCVFDNKDKCWEATNGVRSIYNDSLRSAIDEILDDEEDRLGQDDRYRPFFCHSIYMIGRKQKRSNPVILFCCEDASLRIKARDLVKASVIMRNHATIRLGHASFPPELNAPPCFAAESQARMDLKDDERPLKSDGRQSSFDIRKGIPSLPLSMKRRSLPPLPPISHLRPSATAQPRTELPSIVVSPDLEQSKLKSGSTAEKVQQVPLVQEPPSTFSLTIEEGPEHLSFRRWIYSSSPKPNLCGVQVAAVQILQRTRRSDLFTPPVDFKMTIGGAILLNGGIYGLTAAHGLLEGHLTSQDSSCLVRSVAYDGDSGVDVEDCDSGSSDEDEPVGKSAVRPSFLSATRQGAEDVITSSIRNEKGKGVATDQGSLANLGFPFLLGWIGYTSIRSGLLGLDWALVIPDPDTFAQVNEYLYENEVSSIQGIAKTLPSRSAALAILARGSISGMILGTSVSMRLPGSRKMCEVWTVNLNEPIEEGDCGALVINPSNGDVYGHIVAGNIGTGFAYVIPFYQTQLDICRQFGSEPTFATAEDYKRWSAEEKMAATKLISNFDEESKATVDRALSPMEFQQQDAFQRSSIVELANEPKENIGLTKKNDAYDRLPLDPEEVRDQISFEPFIKPDSTSDEAVLPKFEHQRRAVEEKRLLPRIRSRLKNALWIRKVPLGPLTRGKDEHKEHPASSSLEMESGQLSTEVTRRQSLDLQSVGSIAAESAPTSSRPIVTGVSKSETGFDIPTGPEPEPPSKFLARVKEILHPKQKEDLSNSKLSTGEYVGVLPGLHGIWTAVGPARGIWNQLAPSIRDLLEARLELSSPPLTMQMFMVGKTVEATTPTIFIMCEDETLRKEVVRLVAKSSLLDQFPGVKISDGRQFPDSRYV